MSRANNEALLAENLQQYLQYLQLQNPQNSRFFSPPFWTLFQLPGSSRTVKAGHETPCSVNTASSKQPQQISVQTSQNLPRKTFNPSGGRLHIGPIPPFTDITSRDLFVQQKKEEELDVEETEITLEFRNVISTRDQNPRESICNCITEIFKSVFGDSSNSVFYELKFISEKVHEVTLLPRNIVRSTELEFILTCNISDTEKEKKFINNLCYCFVLEIKKNYELRTKKAHEFGPRERARFCKIGCFNLFDAVANTQEKLSSDTDSNSSQQSCC